MDIEIGKSYRAETTTSTAQHVIITVSAVDRVVDGVGTYVYGYRRPKQGARPRQTMYPQLYFIREAKGSK